MIKGWQFRSRNYSSPPFSIESMLLQGIQLHIMSSYLSCQPVCLTHLMSMKKIHLPIHIIENKPFSMTFGLTFNNSCSTTLHALWMVNNNKGSVQNDVQCPTISLLFSDVWLSGDGYNWNNSNGNVSDQNCTSYGCCCRYYCLFVSFMSTFNILSPNRCADKIKM